MILFKPHPLGTYTITRQTHTFIRHKTQTCKPFSEIIYLFLQFQRRNLDAHLQANMREHLDLACVKIDTTQVELKNAQETTRELEEKLEGLQMQLDLARVKRVVQLFEQKVQLDKTRVQLDETRVQFDETRVQFDETQAQLRSTQAQLKNAQETTRKLEEKLEALQTQLETKVNADKGADNKRFIWKTENSSEILRQAKAEVKETKVSVSLYTGCYGYKLEVLVRPHCKEWGHVLHKNLSTSASVHRVGGEYDRLLARK